jgi:hypothetical protein
MRAEYYEINSYVNRKKPAATARVATQARGIETRWSDGVKMTSSLRSPGLLDRLSIGGN